MHKLEAGPREKLMERVERRYLSGERCTLAQVWLYRGAVVPSHTHESEQISYIVEGALRFRLGTDGLEEHVARSGEVLVIPSRVPHAAEALEDTYDLDFFAPRRDDWIAGDDAYLRGKTTAGRG
ncbi:MAG TPA: cupin domain-containing protein [Candidatus Limnocylindria bacterium]|nr:cupin domain-containing protein [Candidatus Limnocylindria bacterium]